MVRAVPGILAQIVDEKLKTLSRVDAQLQRAAEESIATRRNFAEALTRSTPAIIAEIKKASPSKGILAHDFDPAQLATAYEKGGAAGLSVLTDEKHFCGSLAHLQAARAAVQIPVLRKDFTVSEAHVIEAAAYGADAILLIVAALDDDELRRFRVLAESFALGVLVEVHDREELERAIDSGATIIGVNNRDLHTFEVRLETSLELAGHMPANCIRVAESGISSSADVHRLRDAGFNAFLVGEHLMRSGDAATTLRELRQ